MEFLPREHADGVAPVSLDGLWFSCLGSIREKDEQIKVSIAYNECYPSLSSLGLVQG